MLSLGRIWRSGYAPLRRFRDRVQVYSAPRPPILIGAAVWDDKCDAAACWFIAVAAWVRRLPMTLLKFRVVTECSHKEHLKVVPPFIDLVV
jgi:hypothetical protein